MTVFEDFDLLLAPPSRATETALFSLRDASEPPRLSWMDEDYGHLSLTGELPNVSPSPIICPPPSPGACPPGLGVEPGPFGFSPIASGPGYIPDALKTTAAGRSASPASVRASPVIRAASVSSTEAEDDPSIPSLSVWGSGTPAAPFRAPPLLPVSRGLLTAAFAPLAHDAEAPSAPLASRPPRARKPRGPRGPRGPRRGAAAAAAAASNNPPPDNADPPPQTPLHFKWIFPKGKDDRPVQSNATANAAIMMCGGDLVDPVTKELLGSLSLNSLRQMHNKRVEAEWPRGLVERGLSLTHPKSIVIRAVLLASLEQGNRQVTDDELKSRGLNAVVKLRDNGRLHDEAKADLFPQRKGGTTAYEFKPALKELLLEIRAPWPGLTASPDFIRFVRANYDDKGRYRFAFPSPPRGPLAAQGGVLKRSGLVHSGRGHSPGPVEDGTDSPTRHSSPSILSTFDAPRAT